MKGNIWDISAYFGTTHNYTQLRWQLTQIVDIVLFVFLCFKTNTLSF